MSTVPVVLAALHDVWSAAGVTGLQVDYGNVYDLQSDTRMTLAVGWNGPDSAVATTLAVDDEAADADVESYDVISHLFHWGGAETVQQLDAELFAAFGTLRAALNADPTLGGAADSSAGTGFVRITTHELAHLLAEAGADASLAITVHVDTWT